MMRRPRGVTLVRILCVMACAVFASLPAVGAQLNLITGAPTVEPGQSVTVGAVKVGAPGEQVASLSLELSYDATRFAAPGACVLVGATASSKTLAQSDPGPGRVRIGILGFNKTDIPDGVVVTCTFAARSNAPSGEGHFAANVAAATPSGTSAAAAGGFAVVSVGADADGDQVFDASDNCPYAPNADQLDRGGVGVGSPPDGVGDACQCGDVTGDGRVTVADATVMRRALLAPPTATMTKPNLCDVGGAAGCSVADATITSRALLVPPRATISPVCDPATP